VALIYDGPMSRCMHVHLDEMHVQLACSCGCNLPPSRYPNKDHPVADFRPSLDARQEALPLAKPLAKHPVECMVPKAACMLSSVHSERCARLADVVRDDARRPCVLA
jgi:hypothetical protein